MMQVNISIVFTSTVTISTLFNTLQLFSFLVVFTIAVTLLGAHTVGHVHIDNSGYGLIDSTADPLLLNAWDDTPAIFDNRYYIFMAFQVLQAWMVTIRLV